MTGLREAATMALKALELAYAGADVITVYGKAIEALRAALAEDAMQRLTDVQQKIEAALAEPVQELQCNPHPMAPHGFMRNDSHTLGRYVCACEGWDPYEAGRQAGMEAALEIGEPVQEPDAPSKQHTGPREHERDVTDDLAFIVRNAVAYIKELELQRQQALVAAAELRRAAQAWREIGVIYTPTGKLLPAEDSSGDAVPEMAPRPVYVLEKAEGAGAVE